MTPDQFKFINEKEVKEFFEKKGFDSDIDMLNGFSEVLEEAIMRKLKQNETRKEFRIMIQKKTLFQRYQFSQRIKSLRFLGGLKQSWRMP